MIYTLILLKDGRNILVSDEEIRNGDSLYYASTNVILKNYVSDTPRRKDDYKIIAGIESLPILTYSEKVKQILRNAYGLVDAGKLAYEYYKQNEPEIYAKYFKLRNHQSSEKEKYRGDKDYLIKSYIEGFKAHQSITNKKFSLEDVKKAFFNGGDMKDVEEFNFFIQSLQQPIQLKVEVEMEWLDGVGLNILKYQQPKITNNSILITKIL